MNERALTLARVATGAREAHVRPVVRVVLGPLAREAWCRQRVTLASGKVAGGSGVRIGCALGTEESPGAAPGTKWRRGRFLAVLSVRARLRCVVVGLVGVVGADATQTVGRFGARARTERGLRVPVFGLGAERAVVCRRASSPGLSSDGGAQSRVPGTKALRRFEWRSPHILLDSVPTGNAGPPHCRPSRRGRALVPEALP